MKLSPPKRITFLISLILAVIGALPYFDVSVPYSEWGFAAAYAVLFLGVVLREV